MAGRGPAPTKSASSKRHSTPTPNFHQLPYAGRAGDPPEWPLDDPSPTEVALWRKLWTLPQAVMWERMRCEDTVALYVKTYCMMTSSDAITQVQKMGNEVRQLDSKLGLSPRSMLDLRWEIEPAPLDVPAETNGHSKERAYVPRQAP